MVKAQSLVLAVAVMVVAGGCYGRPDNTTAKLAVATQAECDHEWRASHCPGPRCTYEHAVEDGLIASREAAGLLLLDVNGKPGQCTQVGLDCYPSPTNKEMRVAIRTIKRVCGGGNGEQATSD